MHQTLQDDKSLTGDLLFEAGMSGSARDFNEPRETPERTMLINDTDMTLRPVKAVQTAAP